MLPPLTRTWRIRSIHGFSLFQKSSRVTRASPLPCPYWGRQGAISIEGSIIFVTRLLVELTEVDLNLGPSTKTRRVIQKDTMKHDILLMVQKSGQPVEVGSLSNYLQGFIHPRWCRIYSNSRTWKSSNIHTLPETNIAAIAPVNRPGPSIFRGYVGCREGT